MNRTFREMVCLKLVLRLVEFGLQEKKESVSQVEVTQKNHG